MSISEARKIAEHGNILSLLLTDVMEQNYLLNSAPNFLSKNQFSMLKILNLSGPLLGSDLALILNISRPAISKNIRKMVKLNLLSRQSDKTDRRSIKITITQGGKDLVNSYEKYRLEKNNLVLGWMSEDEQKQFAYLLGKYVQHCLIQEKQTDLICLQCNGLVAESCMLVKHRSICRFHKD